MRINVALTQKSSRRSPGFRTTARRAEDGRRSPRMLPPAGAVPGRAARARRGPRMTDINTRPAAAGSDGPVRVEPDPIHATVARIVIDNPPVNAASHRVRLGLIDAIRAVADTPAIETAVLIGAGRTFMAGRRYQRVRRAAGRAHLARRDRGDRCLSETCRGGHQRRGAGRRLRDGPGLRRPRGGG